MNIAQAGPGGGIGRQAHVMARGGIQTLHPPKLGPGPRPEQEARTIRPVRRVIRGANRGSVRSKWVILSSIDAMTQPHPPAQRERKTGGRPVRKTSVNRRKKNALAAQEAALTRRPFRARPGP
jgi:hypothetical protein